MAAARGLEYLAMSKKQIPATIQQFIDLQRTIPVEELLKGDPKERPSPYGAYYYRAVACMLLSGRVHPKADDDPNMTEVNRIGKEANFSQYFFERIGKLLVAMDVITPQRRGEYVEGPHFAAFWNHDADQLKRITRQAVLRIVQKPKEYGYQAWSQTAVDRLHLIDFLVLFFSCFKHLALVESQVDRILNDFATLPADDLVNAARGLDLKTQADHVQGWRNWLDLTNSKILLAALGIAEWIYWDEHKKTAWIYASPIGLGMLGVEKTPPAPELATTFQALPDLSVFAGAGLAHEKLVPLFRHCVIKRIDQVYEFKLDRKRLAQAPATTSPAGELREALKELDPLPNPIVSLLEKKAKLGGVIGIRYCSALVKPEGTDVLAAIRAHPRLKGYLEPGAPSGYLLIKSQSRPDNFMWRCQELGFKVKLIEG
jgi:hypothetical protein